MSGYDNFYRGHNEDLMARYQAEIESLNIQKIRRKVTLKNGRTRVYMIYPDEYEFDSWARRQQENARAFERELWEWHPNVAIGRIFGENEVGNNDNYGGPDVTPASADEAKTAFAASTIFPLVVTLILLALLRRDVKCEQVG